MEKCPDEGYGEAMPKLNCGHRTHLTGLIAHVTLQRHRYEAFVYYYNSFPSAQVIRLLFKN